MLPQIKQCKRFELQTAILLRENRGQSAIHFGYTRGFCSTADGTRIIYTAKKERREKGFSSKSYHALPATYPYGVNQPFSFMTLI